MSEEHKEYSAFVEITKFLEEQKCVYVLVVAKDDGFYSAVNMPDGKKGNSLKTGITTAKAGLRPPSFWSKVKRLFNL